MSESSHFGSHFGLRFGAERNQQQAGNVQGGFGSAPYGAPPQMVMQPAYPPVMMRYGVPAGPPVVHGSAQGMGLPAQVAMQPPEMVYPGAHQHPEAVDSFGRPKPMGTHVPGAGGSRGPQGPPRLMHHVPTAHSPHAGGMMVMHPAPGNEIYYAMPQAMVPTVMPVGMARRGMMMNPNVPGGPLVGQAPGLPQERVKPPEAQPKRKVQRGLEENVKRTIYVSYIDVMVTEEQLASFFSQCGPVIDCRICGDPNSAMRFAFLEFADIPSAQQALTKNGTVLGGWPLRVQPSKTAIVPVSKHLMPRSHDEVIRCSRTVYVASIDKRVDKADVREFFEQLCGPVAKLRLLGDSTHNTRIAFVEFVTAEGATAALNCSGALLGSLPVRVSPSKTPIRSDARGHKAKRSQSNLAPSGSEDRLLAEVEAEGLGGQAGSSSGAGLLDSAELGDELEASHVVQAMEQLAAGMAQVDISASEAGAQPAGAQGSSTGDVGGGDMEGGLPAENNQDGFEPAAVSSQATPAPAQ